MIKNLEEKMFCFQCEQTSCGTGCKYECGVCGKQHDTAKLQDKLTGALIGLAKAAQWKSPSEETDKLVLESLFTTVTNVDFNNEAIEKLIDKVHEAAKKLTPDAEDYDMENIWKADEDIRSLKSLILFGMRGMSAYAYHAMVLGYRDKVVDNFFYEGLASIGSNEEKEQLLPLVLKTGEVNFRCMELLDRANTESFGTPEPTEVTFDVEKGPFIVITGHDLRDLKLLLEQTKGKGINVYTHGEMLPAHAYPELKKYPHLKGNFGTAWQNQQKEFVDLPAPIVYTTNCLMPPKPSYSDRIFTTEVVSYPGMIHIGEDKDFTTVINKALELGGWKEDKHFTGINGGSKTTVGFGHGTVLSVADKVVEAVKSGAIRHFFLVG
ncbi:MAG: hydroxylamine reductase, partial [Synergistes sp.]|nr:hydroxylamine reductase [Synergistes sp.]